MNIGPEEMMFIRKELIEPYMLTLKENVGYIRGDISLLKTDIANMRQDLVDHKKHHDDCRKPAPLWQKIILIITFCATVTGSMLLITNSVSNMEHVKYQIQQIQNLLPKGPSQ